MSDDMTKAIERLNAEDEKEKTKNREAGRLVGEKWARDLAKPSQLRRMARCVAGFESASGEPGVPEAYVDDCNKREFTPSDCLCWDMHPKKAEINPDEFWAILGDDAGMIEDDGFLTGFMIGALWVWEEFQSAK